ncbi:hypothetical protein Fcan01_02307 [Folsomia candida]|uniref:C2H2-type domain-containing protein n=1 Tax=Folsomia candida TaxID=158441 RepID=A0A226EYL3_FOLCA|nr:hypothetical protein Fcan01_02307 [Folsomia candida]
MVYKCSRCSRHFNSEQALSTHKTGFHKVTLFDSDDAETNQDDSADTSESNETSSDDEPQEKKERRSRGGRRNKLSNCSREGDSRDSSSDASSDEEEGEDDTESQATSIMQAAKNGEMVVTRKLLTDIVRSSEGLPNDNPYA